METKRLPWLVISAAGIAAAWLVYRRGPDVNYDLRNYHYFMGYSLVHWRFQADIAPAGVMSFFNPLASALVYVLRSSLPFPLNAWIIAALQLSSFPILVLICLEIDRDLGKETPSLAASLALCFSLLAPLWWSELGTSFFSSTSSPLVLLGLLLSIRAVNKVSRGRPAATLFAIAGGGVGLACGLKLTNCVFAVALLFAIAIGMYPLKARLLASNLLSYLFGLSAGFAPTSWWNVFLWRRWDSPLFPYYNSIFRSPYYFDANIRDGRFRFDSLGEFVRFLYQSAIGTHKTAELDFTDPRILLLAVLMVLAVSNSVLKCLVTGKIILPKWATRTNRVFLVFCSVSFALWAIMFAYQRYLIPIDLLLGFAIWILAADLFNSQNGILTALLVCLIVSLVTFKIPNWGHWPGKSEPLSVAGEGPAPGLALTPAEYLIYGECISYILPVLHRDSRFFGIGFDPQSDKLIASVLEAKRNIPVRLLTFKDSLTAASARLARFGVVPERVCSTFQSNMDQFVVCEVRPSVEKR
jgi:hypothetical protein